jgi:dephospho-CoA kinase
MIVVGLTGSIGMGKTETARMFERLGVPVFDADRAVHELYAPGGEAVASIAGAFPEAVVDGAVDRVRLAAAVLGDGEAVRRLEGIVHPLVQEKRQAFLAGVRAKGGDIAVLDIPLLFETGGDGRVDRTVVVSAPADLQRERVLARPGMTEEKFRAILDRQMPDEEKRKRADFVVDSSVGLDHAFEQVKRIVAELRSGGE